jgi:uncharacterized damage-inducible protein DinB
MQITAYVANKTSSWKRGILLLTLVVSFLAPAAVALAQGNPTISTAGNNPLTANNKSLYRGVKQILLRSAEKMPEESYNFRPADSVRSYGQIIGHVADSQYLFCSAVLAEKNPVPGIEKTKTSKGDLITALKESFAYCDRAYDGLSDASATQMVRFMGGDKPKLSVLTTNNVHTIEHYGNLVTYMRMKNLVPPTSEPDFMKKLSN